MNKLIKMLSWESAWVKPQVYCNETQREEPHRNDAALSGAGWAVIGLATLFFPSLFALFGWLTSAEDMA